MASALKLLLSVIKATVTDWFLSKVPNENHRTLDLKSNTAGAVSSLRTVAQRTMLKLCHIPVNWHLSHSTVPVPNHARHNHRTHPAFLCSICYYTNLAQY